MLKIEDLMKLKSGDWMILRLRFFEEQGGKRPEIVTPKGFVSDFNRSFTRRQIQPTRTWVYNRLREPIEMEEGPPSDFSAAFVEYDTIHVDLVPWRWPLMGLTIWYAVTPDNEMVFWFHDEKDQEYGVWYKPEFPELVQHEFNRFLEREVPAYLAARKIGVPYGVV